MLVGSLGGVSDDVQISETRRIVVSPHDLQLDPSDTERVEYTRTHLECIGLTLKSF